MPDISMCRNGHCDRRFMRYRYMAKPGHWQSYAGYKFEEDGGRCFEPIKPNDEIESMSSIRRLEIQRP